MTFNNRASRTSFTLARTKPIVLLTGVAMVALGIAVLINPIGAIETLVRIMGWILIVYGGITLASAFLGGDPMNNAPAELAMGAMALVPGLVMAFWPNFLVGAVWTIIGVIVLITGILDILEAGEHRRVRSPLAMPATVSGVITAVLGALVIMCPFYSAALSILVAAIALLIDGITEIIFGLGM